MRKITIYCCLLLLIPAFAHNAFAQDAPKLQDAVKAPPLPDHFYRLDFVIQEISADGKPLNSRSYSTTASTGWGGRSISVRTGSRIPIATASEKSGETQFQYIDIGVNMDARDTREVGNQLSLTLTAEVTSLGSNTSPSNLTDPIIHQNKWQAPILIPIGKPIVVFKSDDLDTKGGMQVVVTASPLP